MTASCPICCDTFNKGTRASVTCNFGDCKFSSCKGCVRRYLLGTTTDPHCMNCKKGWDENFIVSNLNRSFCDKEYKKHRKKILIEREISKLPETMVVAENQKLIDLENNKIKERSIQISALKEEIKKLRIESSKSHIIIYNIQKGKYKSEKRKFIMACPNNNCRGYLSTQYKCELCTLFTCPHCLEIIGHNKTDTHTCNPDNVTSAELIKKETKGCPSCGVRIFKISGCNQMWCTECRVAFDYTTGKIDNGIVHNPHLYAYLAQQNNGEVPRNPQDILCGGLCSYSQLQSRIINKINKFARENQEYFDKSGITNPVTLLSNIHRVIAHISAGELPNIREKVIDLQDFQDLRVDFLLKKKDIEQFGTQIMRKDNLRKKYNELLHIYELMNAAGIERFNHLCNYKAKLPEKNGATSQDEAFLLECIQRINEFDELRIYCNKQFEKISKTYNNKTMIIYSDWKINNIKHL